MDMGTNLYKNTLNICQKKLLKSYLGRGPAGLTHAEGRTAEER